ncbi:MAG: UDP-N-acetyl-D-glucosamine dehydrogenase [Omnitrophica bacterium RIFCSPHIGHO2_02_FULL_46_20]|nr:MAG: UDP-N-acetyl-D-glucosamine dehydrogenase [Omnitrophica bacterium RIFCSPHIGHO2_02_FULL_46_20]OGW92623.1 MAG: UDP-N-acetyl-D-glucosamine dehydrogenase [Omnitrophica bacterium RIFCSPLOWO2_12_FULL_45_13]
MFDSLKNKILSKKAKIGVIGLGYVGLPLAMAFAKKGFKVWGIDLDKDRVTRLKKGQSYILDLKPSDIVNMQKDGSIIFTSDISNIKKLDAFFICVPTPLLKTKEPDVSFIISAAKMIKKHMKRGQVVVLESTTYPGTTEEVMLPILESTGLKERRDFYLAFSPERIDPGNTKYFVTNIPKVVGGISQCSTEIAALLYKQIIDKIIPVSSSRAAEMTKLLENTFRIVNLGLINELTLMCDKLGMNIWEIIDAAKTKPYGFMPFYPGPGVGGHCIPVDPIYLSWKARAHGFEARFINLASEVNEHMPQYVIEKMISALNKKKKALKSSKVLLIGVAYKKDVQDLRESPAFEIIEILKRNEAKVSYYDPYFPYVKLDGIDLKRAKFTKEVLASADCVVIVTDHSNLDYQFIAKNSKVVIDTRNALKNIKNRSNIITL